MNKVFPFGLGSLVLAASPSLAQTPSIEHRPVACVTAEKFPRFEASFSPAEAVAKARVVFQGRTADWYSVAMNQEGSRFSGVLPKPKKDLSSVRYYIEVTDKTLGTNRTAEYTATVVDSASACQGKVMAGALGSASVILQGPAGVAALPAGFASSGVVAGSAAGSGSVAGTAGASSAGAGGGIGAGALVIGGVAVAGGAAAVAVSKGGGEDGSGSSSSQGQSQSIRLDVTIATSSTTANGPITTAYIDVSACRPGTTFGGGPISLRSDGSFDETWSATTPALRVTGRADANGMQATLACVSGSQTGSMSASGSGYSLSGGFSFGPSQGTITVRRAQ